MPSKNTNSTPASVTSEFNTPIHIPRKNYTSIPQKKRLTFKRIFTLFIALLAIGAISIYALNNDGGYDGLHPIYHYDYEAYPEYANDDTYYNDINEDNDTAYYYISEYEYHQAYEYDAGLYYEYPEHYHSDSYGYTNLPPYLLYSGYGEFCCEFGCTLPTRYEHDEYGMAPLYIGITPFFTDYYWPTIVTDQTQLRAAINAVQDAGTRRIVRIGQDFSVTVDDIIHVGFGRNIKITSYGDTRRRITHTPTVTAHFRVIHGATLTLENIELHGNGRASYGGGVAVVQNGHLIMNEGALIRESSVPRFVTPSDTLNSNGGGVALNGYGARFTMNGGTISGNRAMGSGGAVSVLNGATFTMNNGYLTGNESANTSQVWGGGAVFISDNPATTSSNPEHQPSTMIMHNGTISNNTASATAGAIRVRNNSRLYIHGGYIINNTSGGRGGGGIFLEQQPGESPVTFTMTGGTISGNRLRNTSVPPEGRGQHGGGIQMDGGYLIFSGPNAKNITNNTSIGNGGGINWVVGTMTVEPGSGQINITGNRALRYGGGLYVAGSGFIITPAMHINNNTAGTNGGGIFMRGGDLEMTGGTVNNNGQPSTAPSLNNATNVNIQTINGGGVYLTGGNFNMSGGSINYNTAHGTTLAQGGGGVFMSGGNFTMSGTNPKSISGNTALNGAGIYVGSGNFTMTTGGVINQNNTPTTGTARGVGVFITGGDSSMTGGTISGNSAATAYSEGGGVFIGGGSFTLLDGTIGGVPPAWATSPGANHPNANTAADGGGVWVGDGASFIMGTLPAGAATPTIVGNRSTNMADNQGGAGVRVTGSGSSFVMNSGIITQNHHAGILSGGGGILANFNSSVTMHGGQIIDNNAMNGGGARISSAAFTMHSGSISNNTARSSGGGVLIETGATFTLQGGGEKRIEGNAANGTGNSTTHSGGGGVWLGGTMTMANGATSLYIRNNQAPNGMGGGIFTTDHGDYPTTLPYNAAGRATYFQNLNLADCTVFYGNSASLRTEPPINARPPASIAQIQTLLPNIGFASTTPSLPDMGFFHPLNNYDINFLGALLPDWLRLNAAINWTGDPADMPNEIVIHPMYGIPGGQNLFPLDYNDTINNIFHLVITDPQPTQLAGGEPVLNYGHWITTVPIPGAPVNNNPASDIYISGHHPHRILVTREVNVSAATDANITLLMAVPQNTVVVGDAILGGYTPSSSNETAAFRTSAEEAWYVPAGQFNLGRHFIIRSINGNLILGAAPGGIGTGSIQVHGNNAYAAPNYPPIPNPPGAGDVPSLIPTPAPTPPPQHNQPRTMPTPQPDCNTTIHGYSNKSCNTVNYIELLNKY